MSTIEFLVVGPPVAKARARVGRSWKGRQMLYTCPKTEAYEALVRLHAIQAMRGQNPFNGPVSVQLDFGMPIPKSWPRSRKERAYLGQAGHTSRPDVDNLTKTVLDAINRHVWADDAQVVRLDAIKRYSRSPGVLVRVSPIHAQGVP